MKTLKMMLTITFTLLVTFATSTVYAEKVIVTTGSGDKGGTYYTMISELAELVASPTVMIEHYLVDGKPEGGSIKNKRNILNNKIMMGVLQADSAHLEKMRNPAIKRLQALLAMHQEQVHPITTVKARVQVQRAVDSKLPWKKKEAKFAMKDNPLKNISDLKGKRVAAWGGTLDSAKITKMMGDIGFEIVKAKNAENAIALLKSGKVHAVFATVGAPAKWIEALAEGEFKLLGVSKATTDKLADVYTTSIVNYDNLGKTGQSISALTVDSILFTREYTTPAIVNALAEIQTKVKKNIGLIRDKQGTHPAWQTVDPNRAIKWDNVFQAK